MRVVGVSEELANPNVCAICEESPKPDSETVIDTQHSKFDPWSNTQGQKYVCERCSTEIAKLRGFVSAASSVAAISAAGDAASQLANVRTRVAELADGIKSFVEHVGAGDAVAPAAAADEPSAAAEAVAAAVAEDKPKAKKS